MTAQDQLKRVVIKEELVALTGDWLSALLLNQMLYWSKRVKDHDEFLREEIDRGKQSASEFLRFGWIYKSAEELSKELMVGVSGDTIGRRMQALVEKGWLDRRNNPNHKWDKTYQYRVNVLKIQADLYELNYTLENYPIPSPATPIPQIAESRNQNAESTSDSAGAIPETTTEITTEKKEEIPLFSEKLEGKDFLELAAVTEEERGKVEPGRVIAEHCASLLKVDVPDYGYERNWLEPCLAMHREGCSAGLNITEIRALLTQLYQDNSWMDGKVKTAKGFYNTFHEAMARRQQSAIEAITRAETRARYEARFKASVAAAGAV